MTKIFARIRRPSLRWGVIFGIILGVVGIVYSFATSYVTDASAQSAMGYIMAFLFIITGFFAGVQAARETGKWISGFVAGIWVAIFGTVIFSIIPVVSTLLHIQAIVASDRLYLQTHPESGIKPSDYTASDVITLQLLEVLVQMISCALFTTVSGGLGGFVGRRRALAASTTQLEPPINDAEPMLEEPSSASSTAEAPIEAQESELEEARDEATK